MGKDVEGALQRAKIPSRRVYSTELQRAEFESESQLCRRHLRIDPQESVEGRLPVPPKAAIANIKVISHYLTTKVDGGNTQLRVRKFGGNEEVIALIFPRLRRVIDLGLKNIPPSFLRMGLANVDLCARLSSFMVQREEQFVSSANKRRQEIRNQDRSAIRKQAFCLRSFWICLNDVPLAHVLWGTWTDWNGGTHFVADFSIRPRQCQISGRHHIGLWSGVVCLQDAALSEIVGAKRLTGVRARIPAI